MPSVTHRRLIFAGIVAPLVSWGLSVVVIATWPGYDPVSQSISLLANAPLGWLQTVAFAAGGLLGLAWAAGLPTVLGTTRRDRAIVRGLLVGQALITFAFAIFPTDPDGAPMSLIGRLHLADFYAYSVTMPLTLLVLGLLMRRDPRWSRAARPTLLAAGAVVAASFLVPLTVDGPLTPWLGLLERLYVAVPSVWQFVVGVVALRLANTRLGAPSPVN
ncbi:MAG: DUF998 domain-containing protein [Chloroflexota bacterium]